MNGQNYNEDLVKENYELLRDAIVERAIKDYCVILKKGIIKTNYNVVTLEEIERFLLSDWFIMLSGFDGEEIIKKCKKMQKNRKC